MCLLLAEMSPLVMVTDFHLNKIDSITPCPSEKSHEMSRKFVGGDRLECSPSLFSCHHRQTISTDATLGPTAPIPGSDIPAPARSIAARTRSGFRGRRGCCARCPRLRAHAGAG